jgi:hypothetical protein
MLEATDTAPLLSHNLKLTQRAATSALSTPELLCSSVTTKHAFPVPIIVGR